MATPIALLDVGRILEQSSRLKGQQEALKAEMKQADNVLVQEQQAIRKLQEQLRDYRSGTVEYKQREAEIANRVSQLQVNAKLKRKEFDERRANLLYQAYKEIEQEVQAVAMENGFAMVLRFTGKDVPRDNLEAVFMYAGKPVVWFNHGLDITEKVIARLEHRSGYGNRSVPNPQNRASIPGPPQRR
jgi:Skp family chaperone for outer membrane proteins